MKLVRKVACMAKINRTPWFTVALFLLPSLAGFVVFLLLPIVAAFGISLTNFTGGPRLRFLGFENYLLAFRTADFLNSLWG
ncbi:MAG: hypothetical protein SNJ78_08485 [Spirochaetales bacterium]